MDETTKPPVAKKELKTTEIHGLVLEDNYFWLRFKENQEVIDYLTAENEYTKYKTKHLDTFVEELFNEMKSRIKEDDESVPYKYKDYYYYNRDQKGKEYKIYCRKYQSLDAEEEILLDLNKMAEGHEYYKLRTFKISPNQKLLAYSVDTTGYEKFIMEIKDLETGETYAPGIENIGWSFEWADDNVIFYTIRDEAQRPYILKRHILGNPSERDQIIFEEKDIERSINVQKNRDHRYLFLNSSSTLSSEILFLNLDYPMGEWKVFCPREEEHEYTISHKDSYFYIVTNSEGAKNFKVMRTPVDNLSKDNWEELLPHDEDIRYRYTEPFEKFLAIFKREEGLPKVDIYFDLNDERNHSINFPEPVYGVWEGDNFQYSSDYLRLEYTSLITPESVLDYNIETKELEVKKEKEVPGYKKEDFTTERRFITARDGARVPISIVYKKDLNFPAPVYLYGYGAYGANMDPYFSSNILSLTERGMVYVIAHIRGGGELGRHWYEAGKMLNKKNTFYDFIDCGNYLIQENITTRGQLVIAGGSAGGLLVGAVVTMQPDFCYYAVARVAFVDVINTMLDESIPLTALEWKEWGNPKIKKEFDYILTYSPYDNIRKTNYPHMLMTSGLNDPRVAFWEPAKFVAKLRDSKTDSNDLILKTNMGSGHHGASGRYAYLKEIAFIYATILDKLGLSPSF